MVADNPFLDVATSSSRYGILGPVRARTKNPQGRLGYLTGGVLAASVVFGGATRSGSPGDIFIQLISVVLLVAALREIILSGSVRIFKWPLIFVALMALLPAIQLLPLPMNVWKLLPGREMISETYVLINQPNPLLPITMSPTSTWLSALALIPPLAVFLGTLTLNHKSRRQLSYIVVALAIASLFLGLLQLAQGPNSALRFYEITNRTEAVGFFANRNHFAALLYVAILFAAAHFVESIAAMEQKPHRKRYDLDTILPLMTWLTSLMMLTAAQMMARSRAGLILTVLALLAVVSLGVADRRLKRLRPRFGKAIAISCVLAMMFFLPLALDRVLERFGTDTHNDARIPLARTTMSAALAYMPIGSGLGTFVPTYQMFEKTSDMGITFANHAHDDLLELWLETGIPGLALMSVFAVWALRRTVSVWREGSRDLRSVDRALARAASIAVLLLLAHSLVDYPLRTTAMMTIMALATAFLLPTPTRRTTSHNAHEAMPKGR